MGVIYNASKDRRRSKRVTRRATGVDFVLVQEGYNGDQLHFAYMLSNELSTRQL